MRRIDLRQLLTEDVQVDVGRGAHDTPCLTLQVADTWFCAKFKVQGSMFNV
jgi:hypothetical protein